MQFSVTINLETSSDGLYIKRQHNLVIYLYIYV